MKSNKDSLLRRQRCHRSSVALNNIGVSLLERHCYSQAAECFELAKSLLTTGPPDCGEEYVKTALVHLSNPNPSSTMEFIIETMTATSDGSLSLQEGGSCRNDDEVLESLLQGAPSSCVTFPIRIESSSDQLDACQIAIMSHNMCIACQCLAKMLEGKATQDLSRKFRKASLRNARDSSNITLHLSTQLQMSSCQASFLELHCICIAVLNTLIQVQQDCSLRDQAQDTYGTLVEVRSAALEEYERITYSLCRATRRYRGSAAAA